MKRVFRLIMIAIIYAVLIPVSYRIIMGNDVSYWFKVISSNLQYAFMPSPEGYSVGQIFASLMALSAAILINNIANLHSYIRRGFYGIKEKIKNQILSTQCDWLIFQSLIFFHGLYFLSVAAI